MENQIDTEVQSSGFYLDVTLLGDGQCEVTGVLPIAVITEMALKTAAFEVKNPTRG